MTPDTTVSILTYSQLARAKARITAMEYNFHFKICTKSRGGDPLGIGSGYHHKWLFGGSTFYIHLGLFLFSITVQPVQ